MSQPVILIGHGCTAAKALLPELMDIGVPVLTTWQAIDLVDNFHQSYYGRPGIYGQRAANKILYNASTVYVIGARMSIWACGYGDFAPSAVIHMYDIDERELDRKPLVIHHHMHAKQAISEIISLNPQPSKAWIDQCNQWRTWHPWLEPMHISNDHINSYDFAASLQPYMRDDEIVVTDAGSACVAPFQVMRFKPPQRLMTSGGLGEMGCALPAAIGASIASGKRVLCFVGDGAMMLNLQELETISHRNLNVKIFVFANDGYAMIRGTQNTTLGGRYVAVNEETGVSIPHFSRIADAFKIRSDTVWKPEHMEMVFRHINDEGPYLAEIMLNPNQVYGPKLQPVRNPDGTIGNAIFSEMSP